MNTNSNTYTIVYASIMVIIVAFLLAFVSGALQEKQDDNVALDKKKQILSSLNVDLKSEDPATLYNEMVLADKIYDFNGTEVAANGGFLVDVKTENAKDTLDRQLPVYVCQVEGATKYVLPVYGAGLWGPIWGYVALNDDKDTVFGVYFSHASETPGLGAEIANPKFQNKFPGKKISRDSVFTSIAIVKVGKVNDSRDYVEGISGGTITSQGVDAMLLNGLGQYVNFLNK